MHQRLSTTFVSGLITLNTRRLRDRNSSSFICSKIAISKSTKDCLEFASTFRLYLSNFFWKSRPNGMATRDQQPSIKQLSIKVVVMKQFSWRVKENYVPQELFRRLILTYFSYLYYNIANHTRQVTQLTNQLCLVISTLCMAGLNIWITVDDLLNKFREKIH